MRRLFMTCVLVAASLGGAAAAQAQTRADSAAVLLRAAEELRVAGETDAARAVLDLIARRYAGTPAADDVARLRSVLRRTPDRERSGRTELMVFGATYGAWLGIALPLALDSDSPEAYGLGLLLGAPAGFLAARGWANRHGPTEGQTRALTFGGSWGTYQGFLWGEVFDFGQRTERYCPEPAFGEPCYTYETDGDPEARVMAAIAGGLAGIGVGALLARKPITAGTAAAVTLSALWGSWFAYGTAFLADQEDDALLAAGLIGGNVAMLATGVLAPSWQISESRARLISVGGLIGLLGGAGLVLLAQPDNEKVAMSMPLIGSAAGLVAAAHSTRSREREDGQQNDRDAVLNFDGHRWGMGTPDVSLRLQRTSAGRTATALHVPLLRARF
jgi:hypothetical protein